MVNTNYLLQESSKSTEHSNACSKTKQKNQKGLAFHGLKVITKCENEYILYTHLVKTYSYTGLTKGWVRLVIEQGHGGPIWLDHWHREPFFGFFTIIGAHTFFGSGAQNFSRQPCLYTIANGATWFVNRYRIAASNATRLSYSQKNNAYSSFFEKILKK